MSEQKEVKRYTQVRHTDGDYFLEQDVNGSYVMFADYDSQSRLLAEKDADLKFAQSNLEAATKNTAFLNKRIAELENAVAIFAEADAEVARKDTEIQRLRDVLEKIACRCPHCDEDVPDERCICFDNPFPDQIAREALSPKGGE